MSEDLTEKLPSSDREKMNLILATVQNLSSTVENLSATVQNLVADVADIKLRLANLEQKVEERLYDTRPIWEKVTAEISQLQEGMRETKTSLTEEMREFKSLLSEEMREIKTHLRDIYRRLSIFNDTLVTMQADYRDIYDRVRRLELGPG